MTAKVKNPYAPIFGLAKALGMTKEDIKTLAYGETGKTSLKALTGDERSAVIRALAERKDTARGVWHGPDRERIDEGGNPRTRAMRRKLYMLCRGACWGDGFLKRVNGITKRLCGKDDIKWATPAQCIQVTEAVKAIIKREARHEKA